MTREQAIAYAVHLLSLTGPIFQAVGDAASEAFDAARDFDAKKQVLREAETDLRNRDPDGIFAPRVANEEARAAYLRLQCRAENLALAFAEENVALARRRLEEANLARQRHATETELIQTILMAISTGKEPD